MDIAEVKERAIRLERAIKEAIEPLVDDFQNKTGIGVGSISIPMIDVSLHDGSSRFLLGNVEITIDLCAPCGA